MERISKPIPENAPAERGRHILQWHITHRCNLACAHCYQNDRTLIASPALMDEALEKYSRFLENHGAAGRVFITGGEPFMHPDLFGLIEKIRARGMAFTVLTNGTLIDTMTANRLALMGPEFVQISLDGVGETHDSIRGRYSFAHALRGIDALVDEHIPVIVSFTAQRTNLKSFPALAKVCAEHGVRKLWWDRVVTDSPLSTKRLALTTAQFKSFRKKAGKLAERYRRADGSSLISLERSLQCMEGRCYTCHPGIGMLTLLADGSIMPCRRLPFIAGNIRDGEIDDILLSDETTQKLISSPIPAACSGCKYAETCRGGAKCVTYGQTGRLFEKDVNCIFN